MFMSTTPATIDKFADTCQQVTDRLIDMIETGDLGDWAKSWQTMATGFAPRNHTTGAYYRGINVLILAIACAERCYPVNEWATYKQWQTAGGQVRKGETGETITKWVSFIPKAERAEAAAEGREPRTLMRPQVYKVFNIAQQDGIEIADDHEPAIVNRHDDCEKIIAAAAADIRYGAPAYHPTLDRITCPPIEDFDDSVAYYGTMFHEHVHWTGHAERLGRDLSGRFGDDAYATEELVAELGAAMLCARTGIESTPREDHAQYLTHWLRVLRADSKALLTAASQAQTAADYLDVPSARLSTGTTSDNKEQP